MATRTRLTISLGLLLGLSVSVGAFGQVQWDLARCRAEVVEGHSCTPEHLAADLAILLAQSVKPGEALPKPGSAVHDVWRIAAEIGTVEQGQALKLKQAQSQQAVETARRAYLEPPVTLKRQRGWLVGETEPLEGIKTLSVLVEGPGSDKNRCFPSAESQEMAVARPILDGGLKFDNGSLIAPFVHVSVGAIETDSNHCAAFVDVSLYSRAYAALSYQQAVASMGTFRLMLPWDGDPRGADAPHSVAVSSATVELSKSGVALLTGPRAGFTDRITDNIRRHVDDLVTKIKIANRVR